MVEERVEFIPYQGEPRATIERVVLQPASQTDLKRRGVDPARFLNLDGRLHFATPTLGEVASISMGRDNELADIAVGATVYPDGPDVFPNQSISRRHALVVVRGEGLEVRDEGSRNGLFVRRAGETEWTRVTNTGLLGEGDRVRLGNQDYGVPLTCQRITPNTPSSYESGWILTRENFGI